MINSNERIIKHKIGVLNLAEALGTVSPACNVLGLSRDPLYRYKDAVEAGGWGSGGLSVCDCVSSACTGTHQR